MKDKYYIYSQKENKVLEIKKVEVISKSEFETLYRITTIDDEEIYEKKGKAINVYTSKEKAGLEQELQKYKVEILDLLKEIK